MKIPLFLSLFSILSLSLNFNTGQLLIWKIDFEQKNERGLFCKKLEAYLSPKHSLLYSKGEKIAETKPVTNEYLLDVELGTTYKLIWQVDQPRKKSADYEIRIYCHLFSPKAKEQLIAFSQPFSISGPSLHQTISGDLYDITPLSFFNENPNFMCPINLDKAEIPVRDDKGNLWDAKNELDFLSLPSANDRPLSPLAYEIEKLSLDEHSLAHYERMAKRDFFRLARDEDWHFRESLTGSNLETEEIYALTIPSSLVLYAKNHFEKLTIKNLISLIEIKLRENPVLFKRILTTAFFTIGYSIQHMVKYLNSNGRLAVSDDTRTPLCIALAQAFPNDPIVTHLAENNRISIYLGVTGSFILANAATHYFMKYIYDDLISTPISNINYNRLKSSLEKILSLTTSPFGFSIRRNE